ncbi:hypothetical protein JCM15765_29710 [Paradesulfitobacterium aromaticivorans]
MSGAYGFLVFPNTDYYIVATKEGYNQYTSPTISVEQEIVNWNLSLHVTGTERLSGQDRVDTSLVIAKATYPNKVSNVVLATANNYPDALTGSVLASKLNAPILLVGISEADQAKILTYLQDNMKPTGTVYILGGTVAISSDMEVKIKGIGFGNIDRIGGADRFATSLEVAKYFNLGGNLICVASGNDYPDALSGSIYAAVNKALILLTANNTLSKEELTFLNDKKITGITIFGGEGAVTQAVQQQLPQLTGQ